MFNYNTFQIMTESLVKAEKAQPANYAGMNYESLCNYVKTQINLETKKQVGMQVMNWQRMRRLYTAL